MVINKNTMGASSATEGLFLRNRVALVVLFPLLSQSLHHPLAIISPESSHIGAHISRSMVSHFHSP